MATFYSSRDGQPVVMNDEEWEYASVPSRLIYEEGIWAQRISPDFSFCIGKVYPTLGGELVRIVEKTDDCVKGDDNVWRYDREKSRSDFGRTTACTWDDSRNLIPFEVNV